MCGTEGFNTAILSTILSTTLLRLPTLLYLCKAKAFCSDKTCFRYIMHELKCDIVMSECESVRQAPSTSSLSGESSDWECRCSNAWIGCRRGQKCLMMPCTRGQILHTRVFVVQLVHPRCNVTSWCHPEVRAGLCLQNIWLYCWRCHVADLLMISHRDVRTHCCINHRCILVQKKYLTARAPSFYKWT